MARRPLIALSAGSWLWQRRPPHGRLARPL